jgi:Arylsulfotransferase (ASST)
MSRIFIALLLFIQLPLIASSQLFPKEGATLNYRLIGFSFATVPQASIYVLQIAKGNHNNDDSFKKYIVTVATGKTNRIMAEVPSFGDKYTWRVSYTGDNSNITPGELYHFSTGFVSEIDSNVLRLRITKTAQKYSSAYVFLDGNKAMYNMEGKPVWYLPNIEGLINERTDVRDIKLTPQGTITFLMNDKKIYEIDYSGNILWKGPENETPAYDFHYHHQFTRLANGHYMVLGTETASLRLRKGQIMDSLNIAPDNNKDSGSVYFTFPLGTVIEYDEKGNVVWLWKTSQHFGPSGLAYTDPRKGKNRFDVHENAFFFDEKNSIIYMSFRNTSEILKIKYPEGTVISSLTNAGNTGFCGQHSPRLSDQGYLYLFDNNTCNIDSFPRLMKLKETGNKKTPLKKIWEYTTNLDGMFVDKQRTAGFTSGGHVSELPDHCIFASMCAPYSKVFIVSPEKEILWSAIPEIWSPREKKWVLMPQYRTHIIIDPKDLERLLWHE